MERGVRIKLIGSRRMDVSNDVSGVTEVFAGQYREMYIKERTKLNAFEYARTRLKEEQGKVAALKGNALKEKVAEILYLKSLTKVDQAARNSEKFKQSLLPAHIASQKQKIMGSPEFKSFEKMPENQLRAMAAGKGAKNLMDNFMKTVAKVKEAQKQMQQRVNAPKQNGVPEAQKPAGPGVPS